LEAQVAHIVNNMEYEVNTTVSEIKLEMEIVLLQHFDDSSKSLDAATSKILEPTSAILDSYERLLAEMVPDVHPSLAATANLAADSVAADAELARYGEGGLGRGRSATVSRWEAAVTKLAATDPAPTGPVPPTNGQQPGVGLGSSRMFHTSPMTALLVSLGALFAGVALAGGNGADSRRRPRQSYESLL